MSSNRWLALLIVISAGLFAVGAAIERNQNEGGHKEPRAAPTTASESGGETHSEKGESPTGETSSESSSETHSESSEEIFGVNPESTGLVVAAIVAAVLLAVAVWFFPQPIVLVAVIVFGIAFAVFDIREVVHQIDESRGGLVVIASALAVIHLGVATLAAAIWRSPTARNPRVAAS